MDGYVNMICPACDNKNIEIKNLLKNTKLKGEDLSVYSDSYSCISCSHTFMNDDQMNIFRQKVSDEYKRVHALLTSDELKSFRHNLGMTQNELATYLGVGTASIKRWETYFVQDLSHDKLIRLKCDEKFASQNILEVLLKRVPSVYTGGRPFSFNKLKELIKTLVEYTKSPLFLNKALFYVDFLHFKKHQVSVTGCPYVKFEYGPCPSEFRRVFENLRTQQVLAEVGGHDLVCIEEKDSSVLSDLEVDTINHIIELSRDDGGEYLLEVSHEEDAFKKSSYYCEIAYSHAKALKI